MFLLKIYNSRFLFFFFFANLVIFLNIVKHQQQRNDFLIVDIFQGTYELITLKSIQFQCFK